MDVSKEAKKQWVSTAMICIVIFICFNENDTKQCDTFGVCYNYLLVWMLEKIKRLVITDT